MDQQTTSYVVVFTILALVMGLRIWRSSGARKLKVERMWIRPLIILVFLGLSIGGQPPPMTPVVLGSLAAVTVLGLVVGVYRGRMVKVSINPETHDLTSQQSPWGILIFLGLMIVRMGVRVALRGADEFDGIPVAAIVDGLTLFYAGNVVGMQVDVWMRANKLLRTAIAAKEAGKPVPAELIQDHAGEKAHS